ncbi:uncharacterized protein LOC135496512 [Lineus longissimus]|uniref:uncharacterized protein LOC135496512 n=1 Tax=Lineus longissimus TaxID=88925 RepID=UPI00315C6C01
MIVLFYIKNESKRYQTFVANRVAKIHKSTVSTQWRHVPTDQNPADDVSRGMTAEELITSDRWVQGPEFLKKPEADWPKQPDIIEESQAKGMEEVKAEVKVYHASRENPNDPIGRMVKHYSCWYRLKKGVAWMRLKKLLRKRLKDKDDQATPASPRDSLTVSELRETEREVLKFVQREAFDDVQSKRSVLRKLNPILDANGGEWSPQKL